VESGRGNHAKRDRQRVAGRMRGRRGGQRSASPRADESHVRHRSRCLRHTLMIERQVIRRLARYVGMRCRRRRGRLVATRSTRIWRQTAHEFRRGFVHWPRCLCRAAARASRGVAQGAKQAGAKGAMIGTQPKGKGGVLDDPVKRSGKLPTNLGSYFLFHLVFESGGCPVRASITAWRMRGAPHERARDVRLIYAGHGTAMSSTRWSPEWRRRAAYVIGPGGFCAGIIHSTRTSCAIRRDARREYYDTMLQDPRALRYLADIVDAGRIMMGYGLAFPIRRQLAPPKIVMKQDSPLPSAPRPWRFWRGNCSVYEEKCSHKLDMAAAKKFRFQWTGLESA